MIKRRRRYTTKEKKKHKKIDFSLNKILFVLVVILFVSYVIYTYVGFSNIKSIDPLNASNSSYYLLSNKKDALDKTLIIFEEEYNGKEIIKSVYMYAENKEKGTSVLIYMPGQIEYAGLEKEFGNPVSISALRYAGDFVQKGRGVEYAIWQFQQIFGSNIDQYIWISAGASKVFQERLGESFGDSMYAQYYSNGFEVSEGAFFLNSFVSRLGWPNLLIASSRFRDAQAEIYSSFPTLANIVVKLKEVHKSTLSTNPYLIDFGKGEYLTVQESSNGIGLSSYINVTKFDSVWRNFIDSMIDRKLEKERARVEIYNGSGFSGYAAQYARRIRNSGLEVVRYDNAPLEQNSTEFFVPHPEEYSNSLDIVMEIFPGTYDIIESRPSFMTTGDIVIILGKDIPTIYSF